MGPLRRPSKWATCGCYALSQGMTIRLKDLIFLLKVILKSHFLGIDDFIYDIFGMGNKFEIKS